MRDVVLVGAFITLWFLALQVVLPIGTRSADETIAGNDPGAPASPRLMLKFAAATAIAIVLWGIFYALVLMRMIQL
jgi:predicted secreted protein